MLLWIGKEFEKKLDRTNIVPIPDLQSKNLEKNTHQVLLATSRQSFLSRLLSSSHKLDLFYTLLSQLPLGLDLL